MTVLMQDDIFVHLITVDNVHTIPVAALHIGSIVRSRIPAGSHLLRVISQFRVPVTPAVFKVVKYLKGACIATLVYQIA